MSLKLVKNKIKSIDKTRKVTKAMEAVSAVKMRKSQEIALVARPYALNALKILQSVSGSVDGSFHPLAKARPVSKTCYIVVTSDKGLAGSLNSAVLKEFHKTVKNQSSSENSSDPHATGIITIGRRGYEHLSKRGYTIIEKYEQWGDFVSFDTVEPLINRIKQLFVDGEYDEILIIYTNFISTLRQEVYIRKLLPLSFEGLSEIVEGILPETGKFADISENKHDKSLPARLAGASAKRAGQAGQRESALDVYTFEPNAETVLEELIPLLLKIQVYHSVLESNASEHSSRMIAMKNASDNAEDILKDLRLSYNKARQSAITREVSEIVSGTLI